MRRNCLVNSRRSAVERVNISCCDPLGPMLKMKVFGSMPSCTYTSHSRSFGSIVWPVHRETYLMVGPSPISPLVPKQGDLVHVIEDHSIRLSVRGTLYAANLLSNFALSSSGKREVKSIKSWEVKSLVGQ